MEKEKSESNGKTEDIDKLNLWEIIFGLCWFGIVALLAFIFSIYVLIKFIK